MPFTVLLLISFFTFMYIFRCSKHSLSPLAIWNITCSGMETKLLRMSRPWITILYHWRVTVISAGSPLRLPLSCRSCLICTNLPPLEDTPSNARNGMAQGFVMTSHWRIKSYAMLSLLHRCKNLWYKLTVLLIFKIFIWSRTIWFQMWALFTYLYMYNLNCTLHL